METRSVITSSRNGNLQYDMNIDESTFTIYLWLIYLFFSTDYKWDCGYHRKGTMYFSNHLLMCIGCDCLYSVLHVNPAEMCVNVQEIFLAFTKVKSFLALYIHI